MDNLVKDHDIVLLQEHWLYESQLCNLAKLGNGYCVMGTSSMDENVPRLGRPYGGSAILWSPSLKCKITPITCESSRLCAIILYNDNATFLVINSYMPCDKGYRDDTSFPEFVDVLRQVRVLIDKYDPNFVIYGGDFNTDLSRATSQSLELSSFVDEYDLYVCSQLPCSNVPYTFVNSNNSISTIDHFIVSKNLVRYVNKYDINDNHLFSDHFPLCMTLDIEISHLCSHNRVFRKKVSWSKASDSDIANYKVILNEMLSNIQFDNDALKCKDKHCVTHWYMICKMYNQVLQACIKCAEICIPYTKPGKKCTPGWSQYVENHKQESLYVHSLWKQAGCPNTGELADMRRDTRARYHKAVKLLKHQHNKIRMEKMAEALVENNQRNMWKEVRKIKGKNSYLPSCVDDCMTDEGICNLFAGKYSNIYNSVPYDASEMSDLKSDIATLLKNNSNCTDYVINTNDVIAAVKNVKLGKDDGTEGLYSDHIINGCHRLYTMLGLLYTSMLVHGLVPSSMMLGTMVPIPKNKRKSLADSNNYRSIALSSILGKVFDLIVLKKEQDKIITSDSQFGFKAKSSTTQCTFVLNECINYYNFKHTSVYVLMLDATKAFDRVHYCKLFRLLLKRNVHPLVLRLLINMYTNQCLQVRWGNNVSNTFSVMNGVKQGGVMSPVLFSVYIDDLLIQLKNSGIGCHIGNRYVGTLAYADDLTLICPTLHGMRKMVEICENYAKQYSILFNGSKSQLMLFRGRNCNELKGDLFVNGALLKYCDEASHLGHYISTVDNEKGIKQAISSFWKSFNLFMTDFGHVYSFVKCKLFKQYCCAFYGSPLWDLNSTSAENLCIAWRKALRVLWNVNYRTHCNIIEWLSDSLPLDVQFKCRFVKFMNNSLSSDNIIVRTVSSHCLSNPMSTASSNYREIFNQCNGAMDDLSFLIGKYKMSQCDEINIHSLKELILIRDGYAQCDVLNHNELSCLIDNICTT
jgi:exonuclease III